MNGLIATTRVHSLSSFIEATMSCIVNHRLTGNSYTSTQIRRNGQMEREVGGIFEIQLGTLQSVKIML